MSTILIYICLVFTTILYRIDAVEIGDTGLFTDTNYQISSAREDGFNILTYADIYTEAGEKFVQLDDHQDRESKYVKGGSWFQDSLWRFELYSDSLVIIRHVLYPGQKLVIDTDVGTPANAAPANHYIILSNSEVYDSQPYNLNAIWDISKNPRQPGTFLIRNFGNHRSPVPRRYGNNFYKWVVPELDVYPFYVKEV